jgi:hypothetical protein
MNVSDQIAAGYSRRAIYLFRYEAGLRRKVRGMMDRLHHQLQRDLLQFDPTAVSGLSYRQKRLVALDKQVSATLRTGVRNARRAVEDELLELAEIEADHSRIVVHRALGVDVMTTRVPTEVLENLVGDTMIHGTPASEYWSRVGVNAQRRFMDAVRMGVLRGDSIDVIRRSANFASLGASRREAEATTRTAVLAVHNQTNEAVFQANSDIIRGVQALVTFDGRTSEICIARSGGAWNLETGAALPDSAVSYAYPGPPPWHFNCRTVLIPVLKSLRQITGRKKDRLVQLPEGKRASINGQIAASTTMDEFLRGQPFDQVVEMIGRTKAEAWRDGDLKLRDLVDQSGRTLTLKELGLAA